MVTVQLFSIIWFILSHNLASSQSCHSHNKSLPEAMKGHIGVYSQHSKSVYLFGGRGMHDTYLNTVYKWNLNEPNSWFAAIGNTPTSRFYGYGNNGVLIGNIIWFIGIDDDSDVYTGNIHQFDTTTDSWLDTSKLEKPAPMAHGCLSSNGTHIFMVDGYRNSEYRSPIMQIYDIADNEWTAFYLFGSDILFEGGWRYQYCSMVDNNLFVMGGKIGGSAYDNYIYKYDVKQEKAYQGVEMLELMQAYGIAVYHKDHIYLVGSYPSYTTNINAFNVKTEKLSDNIVHTTTQQLSAPAAVIIDNDIWIFGGEDNELDSISNVEICNLDDSSANTGYPSLMEHVAQRRRIRRANDPGNPYLNEPFFFHPMVKYLLGGILVFAVILMVCSCGITMLLISKVIKYKLKIF